MKKVKKVLLLMIFLFTIAFNDVKAVNILNQKNYDVNKGEELTVFIDIDSKNNNAYNYEALLSYDSNVLELLNESNFENTNGGANSLTSVTYDNKNSKFVLYTDEESSIKDVLQIKFKVKENINTDKTTVTLSDITSFDGNKKTKLNSISFDVTILDADVSTKKETNNISIIVLIILAVLFILGILFYNIKINPTKYYKKFNNKTKINRVNIILIFCTAICIISAIVLAFFHNKEYKENKIEYLIDLRNTDQDNSDDNNKDDNDIDNNDVDDNNNQSVDNDDNNNSENNNNQSLNNNSSNNSTSNSNGNNRPSTGNSTNNGNNRPSTGNSTNNGNNTQSGGNSSNNGNNGQDNNTPITARVVNILISNYYPNKGETINLYFNIDTNSQENVNSIVINGREYFATKENNRYKVSYKVGTNSGIEDIKVSEIRFASKSVATVYETKVDVLKDKPVVGEITVDKKGALHTIKFNVQGNNSLIGGTVTITDNAGKIIFTDSVKNGDNTCQLNIKSDGTYNIKVEIEYDLDTNELNYFTGEKNNATEIFVNKNLNLFTDYQLSVSDIRIKNVDYESKTVTIEFKSSNIEDSKVAKVTIKGKEYTVTKNGDIYTVEVILDNYDRTELDITNVELENGKKLETTTEKFIVFKNTPKTSISTEVTNNRIVNANYEIIDEDTTIEDVKQDIKLALVKNNKVIETKSVTELNGKVEFNVDTVGLYTAGIYTVEVLVSYDAVDGKDHTDESLASSDAKIDIEASITASKIPNKYSAKNGTVDIYYTIDSNTEEDVAFLTIGKTDYESDYQVEKQPDGTYKASYTVGNTAGEENATVTAIKYVGETVKTKYTDKVEVLKNKPTISDFYYDDSEEKNTISFKLNDNEKAFVSGRVVVTKKNNQATETIETFILDEMLDEKKEDYKFELDIEENIIATVKVSVSYDLDSERENKINENTEIMLTDEIEMIKNYEFTIDEAKITNIDYDNKIVTITFKSTNLSKDYGVYKVVIKGQEYEVGNTRSGNTYSVDVKLENYDPTTIIIEEAILDNYKKFKVEAERTNFVVFKKAPTGELTIEPTSKSLKVNYIIKDEYNTISDWRIINGNEIVSDLNIILKDSEGNIVDSKPIDPSKNDSVEFSELTIGEDIVKITAGKYTVEMVANYNAVDGKEHNNEIIASKEAIIDINVESISSDITDVLDNIKYVNKNETLEINYTIEDNTDENITALTVNGKEYKIGKGLEKQENGTYKITYTVGNEAKVEEIKVTAVKYESKTVTVDYSDSVEVLKTVPTISDFDYNGNEKAVITFTLNDPDSAFISGTIVVTGENGFKEEIAVEKGTDIYDLEELLGIENGKYLIEINITYDLDSNNDNDANESTDTLLTEEIEVITYYSFTFENAQITNIDYENKTVTIKFTSTNSSRYGVSQVTINDKQYDVTSDGDDYYTIEITLENNNRTQLNITEVILEDHKIFNDERVKKSFVVFKEEPSATLNIDDITDDKKIKGSYTITDKEKIAENIKIVLCDVYGKEITTKYVEAEDTDIIEGTLEFDIDDAGTYIVEIVANYDAVDGKDHKDQLIVTKQVTIPIKIESISSDITDIKYVNKGEKLEIYYTIQDNTYENAIALTINGKDYQNEDEFEVQEDGRYKVIYTVGNEAGENDIKVTAVRYHNDTVTVNYTDKVEVLKTVPTVSDFTYNGDLQSTITFKIDDPDEAIISGIIRVFYEDNDTTYIKELEIVKGQETYDLELFENGKYNISIIATYDLDRNKDDDANHVTETLRRELIDIIRDYNFTFENANLRLVGADGTRAVIEFESSNASDYLVKTAVINGKPYPVVYENNNKYSVEVGSLEISENGPIKRTLYFEQIILENGHIFDDEVNAEFKIYNSAPVLTNFDAQVDYENGKLNVSYEITDTDKVLINYDNVDYSHKVIIKNSDGVNVGKSPLDSETGKAQFNISNAGNYRIVVEARYDLTNGRGIVEEELYVTDITIEVNTQITQIYPSNYYPNKEETIQLFIDVTDNTIEDIKSVTINGVECEAEIFSATTYSVPFTVQSTSGLQNIVIDKINYASNSVSDGKTTITVDVLKEIPYINGYIFDDEIFENNQTVPELSFNLEDPDKAFISGVLTIKDEEDNIIIEKKDVVRGQNDYKLSGLKEETNYIFSVYVTYDLDTDELNEVIIGNQSGEQNETSEYILSGNIQIFHEYNFDISDLKIVSIDENIKAVVLEFESYTSVPFDVKQVVINGNEYTATKIGNAYQVTILLEEATTTELTLESVILGNGKVFIIDDTYEGKIKSVVVFKNKPSVNNFKLSQENRTISATFELVDRDSSITKLYAQLKIISGTSENVITEKELDLTDRSVSFNITKGGQYTISILADYNLNNNIANGEINTYKNIILAQDLNGLYMEITGEIITQSISKYYPNKGETIELTYSIAANIDEEVTTIVINNKEYEVTKVNDGIYTVKYTVKGSAGIENLEVSKIVFADGVELTISNYIDRVDVLKSNPEIRNYSAKGNPNTGEVTFDFEIYDQDNALSTDENGNIIDSYVTFGSFGDAFGNKQQSLILGQNKVTFVGVPLKTGIRFSAVLSIDLDTNKLNDITGEKNENKDYHPHDTIFSLVPANVINVQNIRTLRNNENSSNFAKNEEITISFEANTFEDDGTTEIYYPKSVVINGASYLLTKNGDTYTTTIPGFAYDGEQIININSITLNHGEIIDLTDKTITVYIIKIKPTVENFYHCETNTTNFPPTNIKFDIKDDDNAFVSGSAQIYKVSSNGKIGNAINVKKGSNSMSITGQHGIEYRLDVTLTYNLDNSPVTETISKKFTVRNGYNFSASDLQLVSVDKNNKKATLRFTISTSEVYKAKAVIINDATYEVKNEADNTYLVTIDLKEITKTELNFTNVTLQNTKVYNANKKLTILKTAPTVSKFNVSSDGDTVTAKFNLENPDSTLTALKAVLKGEGTDQITKTLNISDSSVSFENINAGNYTVELYGNYDLVDAEDYIDKQLATADTSVEITPYISTATIKNYPTQGENIEIIYNITANTNETIRSLFINGNTYTVVPLGNNQYKVDFTVPSKAGETTITVTKIDIGGINVDVNNSDTIDILRKMITIENVVLQDTYFNQNVVFDFDLVDPDDAFISGYAYTGEDEKQSGRIALKVGHNKISFKVKQDEPLELNIKATYDLDSSKSDATNRHTAEIIETIPFVLIDDYNVEISNVKILNGDKETTYFEKDDDIKITFNATNDTGILYPVKAIINNIEYNLQREIGNDESLDKYTLIIPSIKEAGKRTITVSKLVLNSGKVIELSQESEKQRISSEIEILKDKVILSDFEYKVSSKTINFSFSIDDTDSALLNNLAITITDINNKPVTIDGTIRVGENKLSITRTETTEYNINITATYSRYADKKYEVTEKLLDQKIVLGDYLIEMKDINKVTLYQNGSEINEVNVDNLRNNLKSYFVKVDMEKLQSFYCNIKDTKIDNGHLYLVLDYDNTVQYIGTSVNSDIIVDFGPINGNTVNNTKTLQTLQDVINEINSNPSGTITLKNDIDATGFINETNTYINVDFKGTLDGGHYTIYNLNKPLFNTLTGATIKNLKIRQSTMRNIAAGILGVSANNKTLITNVHIYDITLMHAQEDNANGGMFGSLNNSRIEYSSASNISISNTSGKLTQQCGAMVGTMNNSTIDNCYVTGVISNGWHFLGGVAGHTSNSNTISNTIAKVSITPSWGESTNGGMLGRADGKTTLINNISLGSGIDAYKIYFGGSISSTSNNNYQLVESSYIANEADGIKVKNINMADVDEDFFKSVLSEEYWVLDGTSYENIPVLKDEVTPYLPDSDRLEYDENKYTLYSNLYELIPYFDAKLLISSADKVVNKVGNNTILNKYNIRTIIPLDKQGQLVNYLTTSNYSKIAKIKVLFSNGEIVDYNVTFDALYGSIANYKITELGIDYTYNKYVIDEKSQVLQSIYEYLDNLDYTNDLDPITNTEDNSLYRNYYNDTVKPNLKEFVLKYLNEENYDLSNADANISKLISNEIKNTNIVKDLYTYNYISRWYDFKIGTVNIRDLLYFNGEYFTDGLTPSYITAVYLVNDANMQTGSTNETFSRIFGGTTGLGNIQTFIDKLAVTLGGYSDPNDWFTDEFNGYLSEIEVKGSDALKENDNDFIEYRAWYYIKKHPEYVLPIITLPDEAYAYIISGPSMYNIGSQRNYVYDPGSEEGKAKFVEYAQNFEVKFKEFFTSIAQYSKPENFNKMDLINIDRPYQVNSEGKGVYIGYKNPENSPELYDLFNINFNQVLNLHAPQDGATMAYTIWWSDYKARIMMCYDSTLIHFRDWSHEVGHAECGGVFSNGAGRRKGAGVEAMTDGNITQEPGDGVNNWNLSYNYDKNARVTANLTTERINTLEKLQDFYSKMYETADFLDYVEAKAFLELTAEEQSRVAVEVYYPNSEDQEAGGSTTGYRLISAETLQNWKDSGTLSTVEDLWNHKIIIRPGTTGDTTIGNNVYWAPNFFQRRWYQPHNDNGTSDAYTLKSTAWEIMGIGGFESYRNWYGSKLGNESTDLNILRIATGDDNITWKEYKMNRYKLMQEKWENGEMKYIDADKLYEDFLQALKADAASNNPRSVTNSTNVKKDNYYYIKQVTDDFRSDIFGEEFVRTIIEVNTAQELIDAIRANSFAEISIGSDLYFSDYTSGESVISTFNGIIYGNGHKLYYLEIPLFGTIDKATIDNIKIVDSEVSGMTPRLGALAKTVQSSTITNIEIGVTSNAFTFKVNSTKGQVGALIGYVTGSTIKDIKVSDTIVKGESGARFGGVIGYAQDGNIIENITTTNVTVDGNGERAGGIAGEVESSIITNVVVNGGSSTSNGNLETGGAFGRTTNTTLKDIHVNNVTVTANASRVGGIFGYAYTGTNVDASSANNVTATGNDCVGSIAGESIGANISNVYGTGKITGARYAGGLVGWSDSTNIENAYANSDVSTKNASNAWLAGGFIGTSRNNTTIKNSITFSTLNNANSWKFEADNVSENIQTNYSNNYEISGEMGKTAGTSPKNIPESSVKTLASAEETWSKEFYKALGWSEEIWDFTNVENGELPKLK